MRKLLVAAVVCMTFGMGVCHENEVDAQSIKRIGNTVRIELTDWSDNVRIKRSISRVGNTISLEFPLQVPRSVSGAGVTNIRINAKSGKDTMVFYGTWGDISATIFCGPGNDYVDLGSCAGGYVYGEAGDDTIFGTEGHDRLEGGDGRDSLFGLGGFDILRGGKGKDLVSGGDGNDWIKAGTGEGESGVWGGNGADLFYVLPDHWMMAFQYPNDFNGLEGDHLLSNSYNP
ncbi:MAG: calcium-binding protein [Mariniblastus sp.]